MIGLIGPMLLSCKHSSCGLFNSTCGVQMLTLCVGCLNTDSNYTGPVTLQVYLLYSCAGILSSSGHVANFRNLLLTNFHLTVVVMAQMDTNKVAVPPLMLEKTKTKTEMENEIKVRGGS